MEESRSQKFLIVESDAKYAAWLQHAIGAGWPNDAIVIMDWTSFGRVRTAMTSRDYDIVILALRFDESYEEPTTDGLDWIRKLRAQQGFPDMIVLAEGGSELTAVRSLRLGAADYLPKRLLTPIRLQRAIRLTLRAMEKDAQRRAGRAVSASPVAGKPETDDAAMSRPAATRGSAPPSLIATQTGAGLAAAARAAIRSEPPKSHVSTHTGASLARAAQAAVASEPPAQSRVATQAGTELAQAAGAALATEPPAKPHGSTHTGSGLAQAARAALAPAAAPGAAHVSTHVSTHTGASLAQAARAAVTPAPDPAAPSMPPARSLTASSPPAMPTAQTKDSRQIAPENHNIPGYTILQKIGESEAAAVYLAIAEDLGHNVALKVSKRKHSGGDTADTGQRAIMFQREFEAIAALDHPSIIDLFDYGIHDGVEFLAMEYFPCGDLKARLQNPLTADEAIAFLREIARSLKVVHDSGLIHRDLKPPNVMLRDDGSVVLIDFGLARSLLSGDGSTRTGVLRGSPYYMSPEQAQGEALDARTDLYSLGVMLYEMLAGRKPYLGASAIDVLQQHVMAPVPELPVHHLFYQPLLERLMSKSREARIATCDELLSALELMMQASSERDMIDPQALVSASAVT